MDYFIFPLCILLSLAILHHFLSKFAGKTNLPPGPNPLPIVGNLLKLGNSPHKSMAELAKVYGPIMCLQLGSLRTIVISSPSIAKEVLQKKDSSFCNRFTPDAVTASQHNDFSVVFLPVAAQWRSIRKICNSHMFSPSRLDSSKYLRKKKLEDLLSYVESCRNSGEVVDVGKAVFNTSLNLLSNTFFSIDLVTPNSSESRELVWNIMVEVGKPNFSDFFPILKRFDPQGIRYRLETHFEKLIKLFNTIISQRLAEKDGCLDESSDILDTLLKISRDNSEELHPSFVPHLLLDLFLAGSETTSSTVEWAMAELLQSPNKMKKAQEELKHVVGRDKPVKEEDISRLPYLQSIIKETFRIHPPLPFLIPRKTGYDVELCGFKVPNDSQILVNVWAMGRDPSLWENPNSFEPERFLGFDVDVKGRDFELLPFGGGRRICPGLPLAMIMIPFLLGSLINCFGWKLEDGIEPESMDMNDKFGITLQKAQPLRALPVHDV